MADFNGLGLNLGNLSRLSNAKTRSICPENFTGEKGKGGMATDGPAAQRGARPRPGLEGLALVIIQPGETFTLADIEGPGAIQQIWMTLARRQLAPHHPAHLLGRPGAAVGRVPGRRLLRLRLGAASRR